MTRFRPLLIGLATAVCVRVGYGLRNPVRGALPDPDSYVQLAASVAETGRLLDPDGQPSAHREPGYPVLLGAAFKLLGRNYAALLLVNTVLGAGALAILFFVARRLFGERTAEIALWIGVFYPPFIFYGAQSLREVALVFVGAASIASLLWAWDSERLAAFAAAGLTNALAGLTNTTFVPFGLILAPAALAWLARRRLRWVLGRALVYEAVFIAVFALWPLRNYARFHRFVPGSTAGAGGTFFTFLIVPQEMGGTEEAAARIESRDPRFAEFLKLSPLEKESLSWKRGMEIVRAQPGRFVRLLSWRFFIDTWRVYPRPRAYGHSYRLLKWVSILSDGWILPLALLGLLLVRFEPPEMLLVYGLALSVNFVYAIVLTTIRYRISAMPWVILLAAEALNRLRHSYSRMRSHG